MHRDMTQVFDCRRRGAHCKWAWGHDPRAQLPQARRTLDLPCVCPTGAHRVMHC